MDTARKSKFNTAYQILSFVLGVAALGVLIAIPAHYILDIADRLTEVELKVESLEMQVRTNKRLVKATQEMVVPDNTALKEKIDG